MSEAVLLAMQAPRGLPRSDLLEVITDPLLPSSRTADMLAHFFEGVYDLSPESHLSRLLKVVLGDSGAGQLRKRYTYAHLTQVIYTTHFYDLDRFYSELFGVKRLVRERLLLDPYTENGTDAQWEALMCADANYRGRVEQFSRAIPWAGTPTGMVLAANALLGSEVGLYETYSFINDEETYAPEETATQQTYGDLEALYGVPGGYGSMNGTTYARLESTSVFQGRLGDTRGEFIIRPLQAITDEEKFRLSIVLNRLKPAEALLTIDTRGSEVFIPLSPARAQADSTYWHVRREVAVTPETESYYSAFDDGRPIEQPRPVFSQYSGEAWSYNSDVVVAQSYVEDENGTLVQNTNFERRIVDSRGTTKDYTPSKALVDSQQLLLGRSVSDGVMSAAMVSRGAG